jgi:membrane protease subunit HflK
VVDAFRDVSRASSDRLRRVAEGETYRAGRLTSAGGLAASMIEEAEADRLTRTERASGEADSFLARQAARAVSPSLTDLRLYAETISSALRGREKVVLDPSPGHRRQLFLPELSADARTLIRATAGPAPVSSTPGPGEMERPNHHE